MLEKPKVRLSNQQLTAIKESVKSVLGENVQIYIFGSRADLNKKGGDIDILVISKDISSEKEKFSAKMEILRNLYKKLGERKIDLIITNKPEKDIEKIAVKKGVKI